MRERFGYTKFPRHEYQRPDGSGRAIRYHEALLKVPDVQSIL